jgi:uncharacterized membrane protein
VARLLILGALAWPAVLGAAWLDRAAHQGGAHSVWSAVVYLAAGQVCHQLPERSFHSEGAQWPVCARCAGLYLAAPLGALLFRKRRIRMGHRTPALVFVLAAVPTALTLAWEWAGLGTPANTVRLVSAVPLGAAILWVLLTVTHRVD